MKDVGSVRRGEVIKVNPAPHTVPSVNFCLRAELTENAKRGSRVHFFFLTQVGPVHGPRAQVSGPGTGVARTLPSLSVRKQVALTCYH